MAVCDSSLDHAAVRTQTMAAGAETRSAGAPSWCASGATNAWSHHDLASGTAPTTLRRPIGRYAGYQIIDAKDLAKLVRRCSPCRWLQKSERASGSTTDSHHQVPQPCSVCASLITRRNGCTWAQSSFEKTPFSRTIAFARRHSARWHQEMYTALSTDICHAALVAATRRYLT